MHPRLVRSIFCGLLLALLFLSPYLRAEVPAAQPLAEVNGEAITADHLKEALGVKLAKLQEQVYALKQRELDAQIAKKLLAQEARKRGMPIAALLDAEVTSRVGLVTETEIDAFVQANQGRLQGKEADFRVKVRASLQQQKLQGQWKRFVDTLRSKANVRVNLPAPPVFRVAVSTDGAPFRGSAEAPVTLVEFSDFHCPFCRRVQPTLNQLLERYPQKVKLVFRDFPLDQLHPNARRAAEAARCAHDQQLFWGYHDLLFNHAPKASPDDLETYAGQAGLDVNQFQACLSEGVYQTAVQQDFLEGSKLGITGTPMFFINGRPLSGNLPLERFVQAIEEELARSPIALEKADTKG